MKRPYNLLCPQLQPKFSLTFFYFLKKRDQYTNRHFTCSKSIMKKVKSSIVLEKK